jgi:hypothetical protein
VIVPFDQGERENCKPVTVRMKPCTITKSGKKRTHTPDPEQLRDLNLRVAQEQPHIEGTAVPDAPDSRLESAPPAPDAEQQLADQWKPQSRNPWRDRASDADPPKKKPRVARAKVSAASKGVIPTTLGGKLPPVSVLARREFGLRALRR